MLDSTIPGASSAWMTGAVAAVVMLLMALITWLASLRYRDVSIVDRVWSLFMLAFGVTVAWQQGVGGPRGAIALCIVGIWAVRLSAYITWRSWGAEEDRRYQEIRARNEPNFGFKSLYLVFLLQAVLAWIVSLPLWVAIPAGAPLGGLDVVGVVLALFGLVFETVADAQMARFKANPANAGQVMDQGLWRYSRHPNYFGEACMWWGVFLVALAGALGDGQHWAGLAVVVSPLLLTLLLLKVSGVSLLEKDIGERRPAYRDYVARTNAFIPGPPR